MHTYTCQFMHTHTTCEHTLSKYTPIRHLIHKCKQSNRTHYSHTLVTCYSLRPAWWRVNRRKQPRNELTTIKYASLQSFLAILKFFFFFPWLVILCNPRMTYPRLTYVKQKPGGCRVWSWSGGAWKNFRQRACRVCTRHSFPLVVLRALRLMPSSCATVLIARLRKTSSGTSRRVIFGLEV